MFSAGLMGATGTAVRLHLTSTQTSLNPLRGASEEDEELHDVTTFITLLVLTQTCLKISHVEIKSNQISELQEVVTTYIFIGLID